MDFKDEFGHCNVPQRYKYSYSEADSLGHWCNNLRASYKKIIQKGEKAGIKLTDDHIRRLEGAGFKWSIR